MRKSLLAAVLLPLCLLGKPAIAEEQKPEPKISISLDYSTGIQEEKGAEGQNSWALFDRSSDILCYDDTLPELTLSEKTQLQDIIKDVKYGNIDSYSELVESSKSLSENQKIVLLATLANSLYAGSYDHSLPMSEVLSQDTFFEQLQNYLATGDYSPVGVCKHIASHGAQSLNDLGLRADAVTGRYEGGTGHVYVIVKRENGTGIIDGPYITLSDTKNIEKMLEIYQKDKDATVFEHLLFRKSKLEYRLVTKDGKNFLDFIEFDESLNTLKKSLTERENSNSGLSIALSKDGCSVNNLASLALAKDDYSMSGKLNLFSLFAKIGQIKGDSSSPTKEMNLIQAGLEGKLSFPGFLDITPSLSVIYGDIIQQEHEDKGVIGTSGSLMINTNNPEGFNLSSRFAGKNFFSLKTTFLENWLLELGASYKIPMGKISLTPYVLSQGGLWMADLGTENFSPTFDEVNAGMILNFLPQGNADGSIDCHYAYRNYEHELGVNMKLGTKNIKADFGLDAADAVNDFAPNRLRVDAGLSASFENFGLSFKYKGEMKDYYTEKSNKSSLSIQGKIKF